MPSDDDANKAIKELNETDFEGNTIKVNVARPKTERSSGGGYNSSNRGGGYSNNRRY